MISLLYLGFVMLLLIITKMRFSTIIKVNTFFNLIWCFSAIATEFNFAGIYSISYKSHIYIITTLIMFNIIYLSMGVNSKILNFNINIVKDKLGIINLKALYRLNYICLIFMFPILVKAINIINTFGFDKLRGYAYVESDLLANALQLRIVSWIIQPIFTVTIMICVILIIINKRPYKLLLISIIDIFVYTISFGGRIFLVKTILYFIFSFVVWKKLNKTRYKIKLRYKLIGVVSICIIYYLISLRTLKGLNVIENTAVYLVGPLTYFDQLINNVEVTQYLCGRGILGFFLSPILYLISLVSNIPNMTAEFIIKQVTDNYIYISDTYKFNALGSMLYVFYYDGGVFRYNFRYNIFIYDCSLL